MIIIGENMKTIAIILALLLAGIGIAAVNGESTSSVHNLSYF